MERTKYNNVVTVEYNQRKAQYHVFYRGPSGEKKLLKVPLGGYSIYVPVEGFERFVGKYPHFIKAVDGERSFQGYDGSTELRRIWMNEEYMSKDHYQFRIAVAQKYNLFEADVHPIHKFLTENEVTYVKEPTWAFIDIESSSPVKPDRAADTEVTAITVYYNKAEQYWTFAWHPKLNQPQVRFKKNNESYLLFDNEESMFTTFIKWYQTFYPDVITGWYADAYDIPMIINRMNILGIKYRQMATNWNCWTMKKPYKRRTGKGGAYQDQFFTSEWMSQIGGSCLIDYTDMYLFGTRAVGMEKPPNWKLDTIARMELGEGKAIDLGENPWEMWLKDFKKFLKYSFRDVEILTEVEKKRKLISYLTVMKNTLGVPYRDVFWNTKVADIQLMRFFYNDGIRFPSARRRKHEKYPGAYVKEPDTGYYKSVEGFDFASQYPTIIITYNISPETHVPTAVYEGMNEVEKAGCAVLDAEDDLIFRKQPIGTVPKIVKATLDTRFKFKDLAKNPDKPELKEFYHNTQWGLKQFLNAVYGAMAFANFRLFKLECSKAVTFAGRALIRWVEKYLEDNYPALKFLYCDTDGCYVVFPENVSEEEHKKLREELENGINKSLPELYKTQNIDPKEAVIRIEHDKVLRNFYIPAKKRYAGIDEKGKLVVRGIEVVKRNCPQGLRKKLREIIQETLEGNFSEKILIDLWEEIQAMDHKNIGVGKKFSKSWELYDKNKPQHVTASELGNEYFGQTINDRSQVLMFYIRPILNKLTDEELLSDKITDAVCLDNLDVKWPDWCEMDYEGLFEKWVIDRLLEFDKMPGLKEIVDKFYEEYIAPKQIKFKEEYKERKKAYRKKLREEKKKAKAKKEKK